MKKGLEITLSAFGSSSRAQVQMTKAICENYNTTILTLSRDNINEDIRKDARCTIAPARNRHNYISGMLLPIYAVYLFIIKDFDFIVTTQDGITTIPAFILSYICDFQWIVFAHRSPTGFRNRGRLYGDWDLDRVISEILYFTSKPSYPRSDLVISYDDSPFIKFKSKRNHIIGGGTDCEKIDKIKNETAIQHSPKTTIVYIGNMYYHRGIDLILNAVEKCGENVELTLIGATPSHNKRKKFDKNIEFSFKKRVNEMDNVSYRGILPHEETLKEVIRADIGLCITCFERGMPHYKYSYPLKIFEYMRCETAIIATNLPSHSEVLNDIQLVDNDVNEIHNRIDEYSSQDEILNKLKNDNLERSEKYCWSNKKIKMIKKINSIL